MTEARDHNPFAGDADRHAIWEMLMRRDFEAFLAADWEPIAPDFLTGEFHGLDAGRHPDPDRWRLRFADLASYRQEWLQQASDFQKIALRDISKRDFLFSAASLQEIDLVGDRAMARKKFRGQANSTTGESITLAWQTLYLLRKVNSRWLITGFVGYLPFPTP